MQTMNSCLTVTIDWDFGDGISKFDFTDKRFDR